MLRIPVIIHNTNERFLIPCETGKENVKWLCQTAYTRYIEKFPDASMPQHFMPRRVFDGSLLSLNDCVGQVLKDNELIQIDNMNNLDDSQYLSIIIDEEHKLMTLDGCNMKPGDLICLGSGQYRIELSPETWDLIRRGREIIEDIICQKKVVYGINTGFGSFAETVIPDHQLYELQSRLILSHCAGVGKPLEIERARMIFALRINVLSKGFSGISEETLRKVIAIFNKSCVPEIPCQGSVGASGDLSPLAHLSAALMGTGRMWSPKTDWGDAKDVLDQNGLESIVYKPKEGLAMVNGTQFITALGAEAVERAISLARQADVIAALSTEGLRGNVRAFHPSIHASRPYTGQNLVAQRLRSLLDSKLYPSKIYDSHAQCGKMQDAYSIRCIPQVHGISWDTIMFVQKLITVEMNSATDNPLVLVDLKETISGGNFHGEYPAKALDYLAIGVHELGSMSECRMTLFITEKMSQLPAFLTPNGGLNSGFMIPQYTAAALVSENKGLCHPSSVDTIATSAGQEDHVSMGAWSARKALMVIDNVEKILAIELLMACQAIDLQRPNTTTPPLEAIHKLVRQTIDKWDEDRFMAPTIEAAIRIIRSGDLWTIVEPYIQKYHEWYQNQQN
ncbi:unnamed protein product [Rotaria sordida]|uniref:Histidine ammonia-lyase n=1 Tax=Rotaria sordida TaxID=392033 RepID=A0A814WPK9_9BILA|nr:unnamed protein product [Rotaria sordida]CAF1481445.1 unnamed protein product [Rotaria sordida]